MICDPRPTSNGRDARGRFVKGNPGGPGNPYAGKISQLRKALIASVSPQDIAEIARTVIEQAKAGDAAMIRLLWSYVLGEPAKLIDDLARKHPAASLPRQTVRELIGAQDPQRELPFPQTGTLDAGAKKC